MIGAYFGERLVRVLKQAIDLTAVPAMYTTLIVQVQFPNLQERLNIPFDVMFMDSFPNAVPT